MTPICRSLRILRKEITYPCPIYFNSLWPSDTIWQHKSGSTLAQVMAYCLTAPSHYLNQCWLIISKVQWHSSECNFTRDTSAISHWNWLESYLSKILFKSPRGQWVNSSVYLLQQFFLFFGGCGQPYKQPWLSIARHECPEHISASWRKKIASLN